MKKVTKWIALFLSLAMVLGSIPAYADETETAEVTESVTESEGLVMTSESEGEAEVETETETVVEIKAETENETVAETKAETETETEETETESETEEDEVGLMSFNGINAPANDTWDCIWFGEYPQAEVVSSESDIQAAVDPAFLSEEDYIVSSDLYAMLNAADWDSNGDTLIGNSRYHRIVKSNASKVDTTNSSSWYYAWKDDTTPHYFKYQPIKWRVLSIGVDGIALVMADKCLDTQTYHKIGGYTIWEDCDLRSWLNNNFYSMAFSSGNQMAIVPETHSNPDNSVHGTDGGNDTTDQVFLLTERDSLKTAYGFSASDGSGKTRSSKTSTYAKAMGASINRSPYYPAYTYWWLRTPGTTKAQVSFVGPSSVVDENGTSTKNAIAVRPVLRVNLASKLHAPAGTVQTGGTVNEIESWEDKILQPSWVGLESKHNYDNKTDHTWTYTANGENVKSLMLTFDWRTVTESEYDFLYIFDGEDNAIGKYSGDELAGTSISVPGNKVQIRLTTDHNNTYWGFKVQNIQFVYSCLHEYETIVSKATLSTDGSIEEICKKCKEVKSSTTLSRPGEVSIATAVYDGSPKCPEVTVKAQDGSVIDPSNYSLIYSHNTDPGKGSLEIVFEGNYEGRRGEFFKIVPSAATNLKAEAAGKKKVKLTWTASPKADGYLIYGFHGSPNNGVPYQYVGMTSSTQFTDANANDEDYNFYFVFPYKKAGSEMLTGACPKYVFAKGICLAVTNLKAASQTGSVKLTWTKVADADGYLIYGIRPGVPYGYIGMTGGGTTFTDLKADKGDWTFYWVYPFHYGANKKMVVGGTAKYVWGKAR